MICPYCQKSSESQSELCPNCGRTWRNKVEASQPYSGTIIVKKAESTIGVENRKKTPESTIGVENRKKTPESTVGLGKGKKEPKNPEPEIPPMPCLYGCPTARELPGLVPECMLVSFEGYEIYEL